MSATPAVRNVGRVRHVRHEQYDLSGPSQTFAGYIMQRVLTEKTDIATLKAECLEAFTQIEREYGIPSMIGPMPQSNDMIEVPTFDEPPVSRRVDGGKRAWETRRLVTNYLAEHPGVSREDARKIIAAQAVQAAPVPAKSDRRSAGASQAWVTRRAITVYMNAHPGVSREDALEAINALTPGRTRVTGDDAPMTRGRKSWNTRVEREIQAAAEAGRPISRDEAKAIVSRKMRGERRSSANTKSADQGEIEHQQAA